MRRMELYFMSEMRQDDDFTIYKRTEENRILLRGYNNKKEDISFDIIFAF
jgi:hypothetical protein